MTPERVMGIARECGIEPLRVGGWIADTANILAFAARIREEALREAADCAYSACYYGLPGLDREGNKNIGRMVQGTILALIEKKP